MSEAIIATILDCIKQEICDLKSIFLGNNIRRTTEIRCDVTDPNNPIPVIVRYEYTTDGLSQAIAGFNMDLTPYLGSLATLQTCAGAQARYDAEVQEYCVNGKDTLQIVVFDKQSSSTVPVATSWTDVLGNVVAAPTPADQVSLGACAVVSPENELEYGCLKEVTTNTGTQVYTLISKHGDGSGLPVNNHPDAASYGATFTYIGQVTSGVHPDGVVGSVNGWYVYAVAASALPAVDSNGHQWLLGAPDAVALGFFTFTRVGVDPVAVAGGEVVNYKPVQVVKTISAQGLITGARVFDTTFPIPSEIPTPFPAGYTFMLGACPAKYIKTVTECITLPGVSGVVFADVSYIYQEEYNQGVKSIVYNGNDVTATATIVSCNVGCCDDEPVLLPVNTRCDSYSRANSYNGWLSGANATSWNGAKSETTANYDQLMVDTGFPALVGAPRGLRYILTACDINGDTSKQGTVIDIPVTTPNYEATLAAAINTAVGATLLVHDGIGWQFQYDSAWTTYVLVINEYANDHATPVNGYQDIYNGYGWAVRLNTGSLEEGIGVDPITLSGNWSSTANCVSV